MKIDWRRERLSFRIVAEAAWCFILTGVVVAGGFVAIGYVLGYFFEWMVGGP